jgi:ketopantoate reductase
VQGAQLVLFCVKSTDTESAAAAIKPHLAPDALALSLQNGVENADRLRALLPQEVIAAAVYVGTEMAGPGHVRHHGRGELVIERSKASEIKSKYQFHRKISRKSARDCRRNTTIPEIFRVSVVGMTPAKCGLAGSVNGAKRDFPTR